MSGHTPGPWILDQFSAGIGYEIRGGNTAFRKGPRLLAIVKDQESAPVNESRANSRLIAAAPELLDALKNSIRLFHEKYGDEPYRDYPEPSERKENYFEALAAIAKAEGQS